MNAKKSGFTIIEIIIVVMVIALLTAIVIPNMIKSRRTASRNTCISNLKQIQGAIQLWSTETGAASNASVEKSDVVPNYIKFWPKEGTAEYPMPADVVSIPVCPNSATNTDHKL